MPTGVYTRTRPKIFATRICKRCMKEYRPSAGAQKYCGVYRKSGCTNIVYHEQMANWYRNHYGPELRERGRVAACRNRHKYKVRQRVWTILNRERQNANRRLWNQRNPDKLRLYRKRSRQTNYKFYLRTVIGSSMRIRLINRGHSKALGVFRNLLYSPVDLATSLEQKFQPGMTWQNYGEWQIDHIIPDCYFTYTSVYDQAFRDSWSLHNLQPLWSHQNLAKSNNLLYEPT